MYLNEKYKKLRVLREGYAMLFIPLLKNRKVELRAIRQVSKYLSPAIIPLFELICDTVEQDPVVDPHTGKPLYAPLESGENKRKRLWIKDSDHITTLKKIQDSIGEKNAFIDVFRFKEETYGRNKFDVSKVPLAIYASRNVGFYISRLMEISNFPNFIPVISIKTDFRMFSSDLQELIKQLQLKSKSIAVRITEEFLEPYKQIFEDQLRASDYLLYDVGEQLVKAKIIELSEFNACQTVATKILLNSPRPRNLDNARYELNGPTALIDNSAFSMYSKYNLAGFGDYCGLKDNLPSKGGSGQGSALALLFIADKNIFWSYRNPDSKLGQVGFNLVKNLVLADADKLDANHDCPAFKKLYEMSASGGWQTWTEISVIRYIHQVYKFQQTQ